MGDGASDDGLDVVVRDKIGAEVLIEGFRGLDDLGDEFEDGGLLNELARKSPPVLGNR